MTVPITLSNLANLENEVTAVATINNNSAAITSAFGNALDTGGDQMEGNLDMNSNHLLNLPTPGSNYEPVRMIDVNTINGTGITVSPLPTAGTTSQVLTKNSNTNFDVSWKTPQSIPNGGFQGQVLAKNSSSNDDVLWTSTPTLTGINSGSGLLTLPPGITDNLVTQAGTVTLTNKTMDGGGNTFTNLPVSSLNSGTGATSSTFWRGDGTWNAPPSGSYIFLETLTMTNQATINSTQSWANYSSIELIFFNMTSGSNCDGAIRLHSNGSYQNTGYSGGAFVWNLANGGSSVSGLWTTLIPLSNGFWLNSANGISGTMRLYNINNTSAVHKMCGGNFAAGTPASSAVVGQSSGFWNGGTTVVDGVQILTTTGVNTSGVIKIYGIV